MKIYLKIVLIGILLLIVIACNKSEVTEPEPEPEPDTTYVIYPIDGSNDYEMGEQLRWGYNQTFNNYLKIDVYFGENENVELVKENSGVTYYPGNLEENTTYFWKIITTSFGNGQPEVVIEGDLWSFTTGTYPEIEMIFVEGDTYQMGNSIGGGDPHELPCHSVTLNDFYISKYEITIHEYKSFMWYDSYGSGRIEPINLISFNYAVMYCNSLSIIKGLDPCYTSNGTSNIDEWEYPFEDLECYWNTNGYRLPTEAEWEYASRGGINWIDNYLYSGTTENVEDFVVNSNTSPILEEVGTKLPNQLSIYDMSGNVYEMCWDFYSGNYYSISPELNPTGPITGTNRIIRGGAYYSLLSCCRVAHRNSANPNDGCSDQGFRIVRNSFE